MPNINKTKLLVSFCTDFRRLRKTERLFIFYCSRKAVLMIHTEAIYMSYVTVTKNDLNRYYND